MGDGKLLKEPAERAAPDGRAEALLHERLSLHFLVTLALFASHFVLVHTVRLAAGQPLSDLWAPFSLSYLGAIGLIAVLWALARRPGASADVLYSLDVAGAVLVVCAVSFIGVSLRDGFAPEMMVVTGGVLVVMSRAVIVPSTSRYTLVLSTAAAIVLLVGVYVIAASRPSASYSAVYMTLVTATFLVSMVGLSTMVSHVIYGLRRSAAKAEQLGQYVLEEKLGEGGMGVVYRARHALLCRPTAVKLLRAQEANPRQLERFRRELLQTSRLEHPSTVAVFDGGQTPDGRLYYAMELLYGLDLRKIVKGIGPLSPPRVIHALRQVCGSLAEAHGYGLIHRDIKPANLMLCRQGGVDDVAKLLDFGLVKQIDGENEGGIQLTRQSSVIGTPLYMAPEAVLRPREIDHRADLYSLGAVAYYALAGDHMFQAATRAEALRAQLEDQPIPLGRRRAGIPSDLEQVVMRCIAKNADERYQSAKELERALAACAVASPWSADEAAEWWEFYGPARTSSDEPRRDESELGVLRVS